MPEHAQQILVEPEPRRVIRSDAPYVFGIDPSTLRVSIAWQPAVGGPGGEAGVDTRSFERPKNDAPRRLACIHRDTVQTVRHLAMHFRPGFVFIEQPSGTITNLEFVQAVGAITAAVYAALWHELGTPVPVEYVTSSSWKKTACGHGGLRKPKGRAEFLDYPVAAWARENGYAGSSWDEADAMGIAVAARRTVRFA